VKPLYYTKDARGFAFASELKALVALGSMLVDILCLDRRLRPSPAQRLNCGLALMKTSLGNLHVPEGNDS